MTARAVIFGCDGHELTAEEQTFFREAKPWGFILFSRNCGSPDQLRRLTKSLRESVGRSDAPILIDQEGGRVQRLRGEHWRSRPPAAVFGAVNRQDPASARELAYDNARIMAAELHDLGINVDCVPCIDVPIEGAHDIIGDRAFGRDPWVVSSLGQSVIDGMLDGGVLPVIKHVPGHGRARSDSHMELPVVDTPREELERTDFVPFRALARAPFAMTAHVVYTDIDPTGPATTSKKVIDEIVRGFIGFDGALMTDDLSMRALKGTYAERARASIAAGCDLILHCNRNMEHMREVAEATPMLSGKALARCERALEALHQPKPFAVAQAQAKLDATLSGGGMSMTFDTGAPTPEPLPEDALIIDVDGYEGPLDVLLALARAQKVDLRKISILALAEQYLLFIAAARVKQLDLAADYLVMASWLAYLKSKLLLPEPETEGEPSADELAERLTLQLQRLEAIRMAATRLMSRDRLGTEVFLRGSPEGIRVIKTPQYSDTLLDLLKAYSTQRVKKIAHSDYELRRLPLFAIEDARHRLQKMLGVIIDWSTIDMLVPTEFSTGRPRRTGIASTLSASLDMARDGLVELRQMAPFAPLYVRRRPEQQSEEEVAT